MLMQNFGGTNKEYYGIFPSGPLCCCVGGEVKSNEFKKSET